MRDNDTTLFCCTIFGFAVVSWLLWKCLLSPSPRTATSSSTAASSARAGMGSSTTTTHARRAAGTSSSSAAAASAPPTKDADDDMSSFGQPRRPSHVIAPREQTKSDLSGCLLQGIVPFRSTPASGYETRLQKQKESSSNNATATDKDKCDNSSADLVVVNRRERARVFARMFSAQKGGRPPNRGANIVVTIQHTEHSCSKLQKALFLLGTYYNLFLLVDGTGVTLDSDNNEKEVREFTKKLRSELLNQGDSEPQEYKLNSEILPPHRIAFSSTSKGRIAFVRQLHGTELVVDYNESVTKELERFGFRVLVYPKTNDGNTSALGKYLIP